jgi:hypothetical protein
MQELDPNSLELILAKSVKELSEEEILSLISHYRATRAKFLLDEAQGKKAGRKAASPKEPSEKAKKSAELAALIEDLDLS